jgi:hypothetical protein
MRRKNLVSVALFLVLFVTADVSFGQKPAQKSAPDVSAQKAQEIAARGWDTTTVPVPGAKILRVWQNKALGLEEWPEIAIMELPPSLHEEFHRDPTAFINKHKIFSKPVQAGSCLIAEEDKGVEAKSWVTTMKHRKSSGYT